MISESIRGRIAYLSRRKGKEGTTRGGETFLISRHADGRRTLRATCLIEENAPKVLRDVISNIDPDWTPTGGYVQISVDDQFYGASWYRFGDGLAECEGVTARDGRVSQQIKLHQKPRFFGSHPLQADAWTTHCYDRSKGEGRQVVPFFLMCSLHHRGADGPRLISSKELNLTWLGSESVTVQAGTFEALHFLVGANTDDEYMGTDRHPPYHVWVTADGEHILLKAHVTGYMQTYYELTELERRSGSF